MTMTDTARTQDAGDNEMAKHSQKSYRYGTFQAPQGGEAGHVEDSAPCQPILWKVLIKPLPPKEATSGGIVLPDEVRDADAQLTCVAEIVRMGGLAFQAQTKAGLDLSREPNRPKTGSWVLCHQYAGQKIWVGETEYRLLNDTDILAVTDTPDAFRNYV